MKRGDNRKVHFKLAILLMGMFIGLASMACNETADDVVNPEETPDGIEDVPSDDNSSGDIAVFEDEFEGEKIVVVGNKGKNFVVSFYRMLEGELLEFSASDKELPVILKDTRGNEWDIFGNALSGPHEGKRLRSPKSMMAYWFSIATFYPGTKIFSSNDGGEFEGEGIEGTGGWTVPKNMVVSGGPGKDGIPSIDNPKFASITGASKELVVGIKLGNTVRAYPHEILDWHEIVNDEADGTYFSLVYCPLTGTATAWDRDIAGGVTTFGVSGLLFNSNIVPYDRATDSNWSQIKDEAISGDLIRQRPLHYSVVETTLSTWREMYPESEVLTTQTGYSRSYGRYPYGDYKKNRNLIFNVQFLDKRLHEKERVHAVIINDKARVYRLSSFN